MARCNPYASGSALIGIGVPPQCHDASAKARLRIWTLPQQWSRSSCTNTCRPASTSLLLAHPDSSGPGEGNRARTSAGGDLADGAGRSSPLTRIGGPRPEQLQRAYRNARSQG